RIGPAIAAIAVQALLIYALATGLAIRFQMPASDPLNLFAITADPPPPPVVKVVPDPVRNTRPEGAAAPPNLHSRATEIMAPPPILPIPLPTPVVTSPAPATASDPTSGAADRPGPGTGAGGIGDGTGSGGSGDGDGGGWEDETPPRRIGGRLRNADFPRDLSDAGIGGTVGVRYLVRTDGRIGDCEITRSSGNARLDALTCRLIEQRFRYRPSLDARGRPVPSTIVENHSWLIETAPAQAQR
ncbi:TonB family protein, partial [Sphingomonas sp.]|uniref:energy transducer TonB n=1 Tax=Sphingomonas sp. TaxID=28214 RepID=UPI002B887653